MPDKMAIHSTNIFTLDNVSIKSGMNWNALLPLRLKIILEGLENDIDRYEKYT